MAVSQGVPRRSELFKVQKKIPALQKSNYYFSADRLCPHYHRTLSHTDQLWNFKRTSYQRH